jgi:hypothetical protein
MVILAALVPLVQLELPVPKVSKVNKVLLDILEVLVQLDLLDLPARLAPKVNLVHPATLVAQDLSASLVLSAQLDPKAKPVKLDPLDLLAQSAPLVPRDLW